MDPLVELSGVEGAEGQSQTLTTGKTAMSEVFQRRPGCGPASGNGTSIASRRA